VSSYNARRIDTSVAHPARRYNYWLGGKDHFAADRESADAITEMFPTAPAAARANRAFLQRSVTFLVREAGVRQFLDIGTGIPTEPNLHQIAQGVAPETRVVYCDNDPIVLAHAAALLRSTPEGATEYLQADVRDPDAIIDGTKKILDFSRPVALSLVALLHFISDEDGAHALVDRLLSELPSGSYLMMTHATADFTPQESQAAIEKLKAVGVTLALRSRDEFARFYHGLDLVEPGVAVVDKWHPELGEPIPGQDDGVIPGYGAVGRKP
jgi:hypothetical protein